MNAITIHRGAIEVRVWFNASKTRRDGVRTFDVQADNFNVKGVIYDYIQATVRDGVARVEYISRRGGGKVTAHAYEVVAAVLAEVVATVTEEQIHEQALWIAEGGLQQARDRRTEALATYLKACQEAEQALLDLRSIGGDGDLWPEEVEEVREFKPVETLEWKASIDFAKGAHESARYLRQNGIYGQEPHLRMERWAEFFISAV